MVFVGMDVLKYHVDWWINSSSKSRARQNLPFVIYGNENSGKTTVAKFLIPHLLRSALHPSYAASYLDLRGSAEISDSRLERGAGGRAGWEAGSRAEGSPSDSKVESGTDSREEGRAGWEAGPREEDGAEWEAGSREEGQAGWQAGSREEDRAGSGRVEKFFEELARVLLANERARPTLHRANLGTWREKVVDILLQASFQFHVIIFDSFDTFFLSLEDSEKVCTRLNFSNFFQNFSN
jgi:hypothetical protein